MVGDSTDVDWDPTSDSEAVLLNHPDSFLVWQLWRASDYRASLRDLLEQPEWLSEDMLRIERLYRRVKDLVGGSDG